MARNPNPDITGAIRKRKEVSRGKKEAVLNVLNKFVNINDPMNFPINKSEICRQAGVSTSFLYTHVEELLNPIEKAIQVQNINLKTIIKTKKFTENSKDRVIESLKRRCEKIEAENKELKKENSSLLGKLAKR